MSIHQLFLGKPQKQTWNGKAVYTSIFREAVSELSIEDARLQGCVQGDTIHHGGKYKEVYSYALEDYDFWWSRFSKKACPLGAMGENIVTKGLDESEVFIGDRFQLGGVELEVTQPRIPCSALNVRLQNPSVVKYFLESGRFGLYMKVLADGDVSASDALSFVGHHPDIAEENRVTLHQLAQVLLKRPVLTELKTRVRALPDLDPSVEKYL